jgi:hypothetical protein
MMYQQRFTGCSYVINAYVNVVMHSIVSLCKMYERNPITVSNSGIIISTRSVLYRYASDSQTQACGTSDSQTHICRQYSRCMRASPVRPQTQAICGCYVPLWLIPIGIARTNISTRS